MADETSQAKAIELANAMIKACEGRTEDARDILAAAVLVMAKVSIVLKLPADGTLVALTAWAYDVAAQDVLMHDAVQAAIAGVAAKERN